MKRSERNPHPFRLSVRQVAQNWWHADAAHTYRGRGPTRWQAIANWHDTLRRLGPSTPLHALIGSKSFVL